MNVNISKQVNIIVNEIIKLRKVCYPDYDLPISYLTIFTQSDIEFISFRLILSKLGKELSANNGYKYELAKPIITKDNPISLIRIRKPDIHRNELGCGDLTYSDNDYKIIREIAINKGMDVIIRKGYEMIELSDFNINVYAYIVKNI